MCGAHLSDGVGLSSVDDLSGAGAVGGVLSHDLGRVGGIAPGVGAGHKGDGCDQRVTHFSFLRVVGCFGRGLGLRSERLDKITYYIKRVYR